MPPRIKSIAKSSAAKQLEDLISELITEFDRTSSMTEKEFFDDIHARHPDVIFPSMIENVFLTPVEDRLLARLAKIFRESDTALARTVDATEWERAVRTAFVRLERKPREAASERSVGAFGAAMLELAKQGIAERSSLLFHYCPCYLFKTPEVKPFRIGEVNFIPGAELCDWIVRVAGAEQPGWLKTFKDFAAGTTLEEPVTWVREHYTARSVWEMSKFPWVAVVKTDGYEPTMAHRRANDAVRLAIAGLGLRVSSQQAANMSLAYEWNRPNHVTSMMQAQGGDIGIGSEASYPQVSVDQSQLAKFLADNNAYLRWLGDIISAALASTSTSTELQEAWLNALHWYYAGCIETSDARAIICHVTALESMSVAEGVEPILSALEGLLPTDRRKLAVPSEQWTLESTINYIYGFGRSETVHGGRFVLFHECRQARSIASEIVRYALIAFQRELCVYEVQHKSKAADSKKVFLRTLVGRAAVVAERSVS